MAIVQYGDRAFETEMIVFDKDGTLIDFDTLWRAKTIAGTEALMQAVAQARSNMSMQDLDALRADFYRTIGYDPLAGTFAAQGPSVTASMGALYTISATVLYQHGFGWLEAEVLVEQHLAPAMNNLFSADMIQPLTDVRQLFADLRGACVRIAVITSDDEEPARRALEIMGVSEHVDFVAGADSGLGSKPAPDAVWAACTALNVAVERVAVVGDSTTDLLLAARAGAGLAVGVCTGMMSRDVLAPGADVVLESIGQISTSPLDAVHHEIKNQEVISQRGDSLS